MVGALVDEIREQPQKGSDLVITKYEKDIVLERWKIKV